MLVSGEFEILGLHLGFVEYRIQSLDQWKQPGNDLLVAVLISEAGVVHQNGLGCVARYRHRFAGTDVYILFEQQCLG